MTNMEPILLNEPEWQADIEETLLVSIDTVRGLPQEQRSDVLFAKMAAATIIDTVIKPRLLAKGKG